MSPPEDSESELEPARVAELLAAREIQLIDVRTDDEVAESRIADARHIPLERLPAEADALDADLPIVFYCHVGQRSAMATQAFRASGRDARNLAGGIAAWAERGLPIE